MNQYTIDEKQVIYTILELNLFFGDQWNGSAATTPFFEFFSRGDDFVVEFLGHVVFGIDYDDRYHDEDLDTYEAFDIYLVRRAKEIICSLNDINLEQYELSQV